MFKYLRLTADATACNPGSPEGTVLVNVAYVTCVTQFIANPDRAPLTRLWLQTGGYIQAKESIESVLQWISRSEGSGTILNDETQEN